MISDKELVTIKGGFSKLAVGGIVIGIVSFVIGLFDGYFRPLKCNG